MFGIFLGLETKNNLVLFHGMAIKTTTITTTNYHSHPVEPCQSDFLVGINV
jgi:hypothetical protein